MRMRLPQSGWLQAFTALLISIAVALAVCPWILYGFWKSFYFPKAVHGQWTAGLTRQSSLLDLCRVGALIALPLFVVLFALQRLLPKRSQTS